jgi:uncharacterized membrane protein
MEAYIYEWLNLALRWLHFVAGIAWIGSSFYFVWLDNSLEAPGDPVLKEKGVAGELWAVHGGGFYNPQKYLVAPKRLPEHLHWFKWEAYTTWLSGFALLVIAYYLQGGATLLKPELGWPAWAGPAIGVGAMAASWLVYDALCRSKIGRKDAAVGYLFAALFALGVLGLSFVMSGRALYLHAGAMLGTIMSANVFFVIIPGQKKMVDAMAAGRAPDPEYGRRGKQRSVHNNYFTLPVLFAMISNHYGMLYSDALAALWLLALMAGGALMRHTFNLRHKGRSGLVWFAGGAAIVAAVAVALIPPRSRDAASGPAVATAEIMPVMAQRCANCHAPRPTFPGLAAAPKGVDLTRPEWVRAHAARIHAQTVTLKAMPPGNSTEMTEDERALVDRWYRGGAR